MGLREDLAHSYRNDQQQYNYYIIALAVACVGYSATITAEVKITPLVLPLGIAISSWLITIYCGIRLLNWRLASTFANVGLIDAQLGQHELAGNHPEMIDIAVKTIKKILDDNSKIMSRLGQWQIISFYVGIVAFIVWRIFIMLPIQNQKHLSDWLSRWL